MKCPNCESNKVTKHNFKAYVFAATLISASLFLFMGIFLFPFLFLAAICVLLAPLGFIAPVRFHCKSCNNSYSKKEYKQLTA